MLRKISGPKGERVTGDWRKFRSEELHDLCFSPNIIQMSIRNVRWAGNVVRMGEKRNAYRVLVGEPEGKRPLGRRRHSWKNNIKVFKIFYCRRWASYSIQDLSSLCHTSVFRSSRGVSFILTLVEAVGIKSNSF